LPAAVTETHTETGLSAAEIVRLSAFSLLLPLIAASGFRWTAGETFGKN